MIKIKPGDKLPIQLQLYDGSKSLPKRVFVELSKPDGTLTEARFEIPHVINGDFRDETRVMTTDMYLTAQYFVYENDGVTEDDDYIINKDIFMRDINGELIEDLETSAGLEYVGTLEGEIAEDKLEGNVIEENLLDGIATEDYTVIGEIEDE